MSKLNKIIPKYVGYCGSDRQKLLTGQCVDIEKLGHEIVGVDSDSGTVVAVNPLMSCGNCPECESDREYLCSKLRAIGRNTHKGGFSGAPIEVPKANIIQVDDDPVFCLADPLAVAIHGWNMYKRATSITIPPRVAIIGDGPIAQLVTIYLSLQYPDAHFGIFVKNKNRAKGYHEIMPASLKADYYSDGVPQSVKFNAVFECVGSDQDFTINQAIKVADNSAAIIFFGVFSRNFRASVSIREALYKELRIAGSNSYSKHEFSEAIDFIHTHRKILRGLIDKVIDIDLLMNDYSLNKENGLSRKTVVIARKHTFTQQ